MPFTPRYKAKFIGPLLDNVLRIIERDFAAADVALRGTQAPLPRFETLQIDESLDVNYPALSVLPTASDVPEGADRQSREETHRITALMGIPGEPSQAATKQALRYVRVIDAILSSATEADLTLGIDPTERSGLDWQVVQHGYAPIRRLKNDEYIKFCRVILELKVVEE